MGTHDLKIGQHEHDCGTTAEHQAERRARWVVALTFATMAVLPAPTFAKETQTAFMINFCRNTYL